MALITKEISNHKKLTNLQRKVSVVGFLADDNSKTVNFFYIIQHHVDDEEVQMLVPVKEWVVSNQYKVRIRDENNQPIPNPNYVPLDADVNNTGQWQDDTMGDEENTPNSDNTEILDGHQWDHGTQGQWDVRTPEQRDEFLMMPAYDYFKQLTFENEHPVSIKQLLDRYISQNDEEGFFDFY
ncbi:hypothetical protein AB4865_07485 [Capnocytophaga sp. ARDL2]|uniref:hypothetical protein n=1 Tax=Capnocytophaga sp. ARDL2 TaxID=3238809 RepID=UPI003556206A